MEIGQNFTRFYNFLANLGLVLRDDPPKVVDLTGRQWGASVNGLALSIRALPREETRQPVVLSVVIRNEGPDRKTLVVPGWLFFYQIEIEAPLTSYGSRLLQGERRDERVEVSLGPGDAKETDLPLGTLYQMRSGASYRVSVKCRLEDRRMLTSNEIQVQS